MVCQAGGPTAAGSGRPEKLVCIYISKTAKGVTRILSYTCTPYCSVPVRTPAGADNERCVATVLFMLNIYVIYNRTIAYRWMARLYVMVDEGA